jgi:hypothetical protein
MKTINKVILPILAVTYMASVLGCSSLSPNRTSMPVFETKTSATTYATATVTPAASSTSRMNIMKVQTDFPSLYICHDALQELWNKWTAEQRIQAAYLIPLDNLLPSDKREDKLERVAAMSNLLDGQFNNYEMDTFFAYTDNFTNNKATATLHYNDKFGGQLSCGKIMPWNETTAFWDDALKISTDYLAKREGDSQWIKIQHDAFQAMWDKLTSEQKTTLTGYDPSAKIALEMSQWKYDPTTFPTTLDGLFNRKYGDGEGIDYSLLRSKTSPEFAEVSISYLNHFGRKEPVVFRKEINWNAASGILDLQFALPPEGCEYVKVPGFEFRSNSR